MDDHQICTFDVQLSAVPSIFAQRSLTFFFIPEHPIIPSKRNLCHTHTHPPFFHLHGFSVPGVFRDQTHTHGLCDWLFHSARCLQSLLVFKPSDSLVISHWMAEFLHLSSCQLVSVFNCLRCLATVNNSAINTHVASYLLIHLRQELQPGLAVTDILLINGGLTDGNQRV